MLAFKLEGFEDLREALRAVGKKAAHEAAIVAVQHACAPVVALAKAKAEAVRDTGALAASIVAVVRRKKKNTGAYAYIGPSSKFRGPDMRQPAKYAHLVERGSYRSEAKPFMRPAIDIAAARAMKVLGETFGTALSIQIEKLPEVKRSRMNKRIASKNMGSAI